MSLYSKIDDAVKIYRNAKEIYGIYQSGRSWVNGRNMFVISVSDGEFYYTRLLEWVTSQIESKDVSVIVDDKSRVALVHRGEGESNISVDGHPVAVTIEKKKVEKVSRETTFNGGWQSIVFTTKSKAGMQAVINLIEDTAQKSLKGQRGSRLYNVGGYGWQASRLPVRPLASVFLPKGVKEDLLGDVSGFLNSEERYVRASIPWHRGYLFYGEPGNGKTSTISAVANDLGMSLYNLQLSSVSSDKNLSELFSDVEPNSIMVIEDIDIFSSARVRNDTQDKLSLAGLLNCLDGIGTPHGLLTFITTNHVANLDPALIRHGRVDYRIEFVAPDFYQTSQMFEHVYGEPLGGEPREFGSMAELTDVFKKSLYSASDARRLILGLDRSPVAL